MQQVIMVSNPTGEPCKNCHIGGNDYLMKCPCCGFEFCGNCFKEIPQGDGQSMHCPNQICGEQLELPVHW